MDFSKIDHIVAKRLIWRMVGCKYLQNIYFSLNIIFLQDLIDKSLVPTKNTHGPGIREAFVKKTIFIVFLNPLKQKLP